MSAAYKISQQEVVEGLRKSCNNIRANLEKKNIEVDELNVLLQSKEKQILFFKK